MSCNKCHKKKCSCKKSSCDTECLGCLQQLSTECIYISEALDCIDKPKGTDLTIILGEFCTKITTLEESLDEIELNATNITVGALDCLNESEISGTDLQSVLEGLCDKFTEIEYSITNIEISASQVTIEASECINESAVENMTLQDGLNLICTILENINNSINDLEDCCEQQDSDWFEVGTTSAPNNIGDDIFHTGKVSIGKSTAGTVLDVVGDLSVVFSDQFNLKFGASVSGTLDAIAPHDWFIGHADVNGANDRTAIYGDIDQLFIYNKHNAGGNHPINQILLDNSNPAAPFLQLSTQLASDTTQVYITPTDFGIDITGAGGNGATGSFTAQSGEVVTVYKGIIISIV